MKKTPFPTGSVDLKKLDHTLSDLLFSYRDALKYTENLPSLGRRGPIRYFLGAIDITDHRWQVTYPRVRWVSRPLTRMFVEAHIQGKLRKIIKLLQIELLPVISGSNKFAQSIEGRLHQLEQFEKGLIDWKNPGAIIARNPLAPPIISLLVAFLSRLTNLDVSDPEAAVNSLFALFQGTPLSFTEWLARAAVWFFVGYSLLAPIFIHLGFRMKRIMFNGGTDLASLFNDDTTEKWEGVHLDNIYQQENRVFETLGVNKTPEIPLDFVMPILPFYILLLAIVASIFAYRRFIQGDIGEDRLILLLPLFVCWPVAIMSFLAGWQNIRTRRRDKNM